MARQHQSGHAATAAQIHRLAGCCRHEGERQAVLDVPLYRSRTEEPPLARFGQNGQEFRADRSGQRSNSAREE